MKYISLVLVMLVILMQGALAVCVSPAGNEGQIIYNTDYHTPQVCNGTQWLALGSAINTPWAVSGTDIYYTAGNVLVSGTVSATHFVGDGSGLTGISGGVTPSWSSITGIPVQVQAVSNSGNISLTNLTLTGTLSGTSLVSTALNGVVSGTYGYYTNVSATNLYSPNAQFDGFGGLKVGNGVLYQNGAQSAGNYIIIASGVINFQPNGGITTFFTGTQDDSVVPWEINGNAIVPAGVGLEVGSGLISGTGLTITGAITATTTGSFGSIGTGPIAMTGNLTGSPLISTSLNGVVSGTFGYFKNISGTGAGITGVNATTAAAVSWSGVQGVPQVLQNISNSTGSVTVTSIAATQVSATNISATTADITTERSALMISTNVSVTTNLTAGGLITAANFSGGGGGLTGVNALTAQAVSWSNIQNIPTLVTAISNNTYTPSWTAIGGIPAGVANISNAAGSITVTTVTSTLSYALTTSGTYHYGQYASFTTIAGNGAGVTNVTAAAMSYYGLANVPTQVAAVSNGTNLVMASISTSALAVTGTISATNGYFGNASATLFTGALTGLPTPSNASDATPKSYVDSAIAGLEAKAPARVASTANLNGTYVNGVSGVGATLTNAGSLAALSIDGVSVSTNDRVLLKNQSAPAQNGIYTVTVVGTGAVAWVLTRATDYDQSSEITEGTYAVIEEGSSNAGTLQIMTTSGTVTVGTTSINFTQLTIASLSWYGLTNIPTVLQNISSSTGSVTVTSINAAAATLTSIGAGAIAMTGNLTGSPLISTSLNGAVSGTYGYYNYISGTSAFVNALTVGPGGCSGCGGGGGSSGDNITSGTNSVYAITGSNTVSATAGGQNVFWLTSNTATVSGSLLLQGASGMASPVSGSLNTSWYNISSIPTPVQNVSNGTLVSVTNISVTNVQLSSSTLLAGEGLYARSNASGGLVVDGSAGFHYDWPTDNSIFSSTDLPANITPSATVHVSGTLRVTSWTVMGSNVTATTTLDVYGTVSASTLLPVNVSSSGVVSLSNIYIGASSEGKISQTATTSATTLNVTQTNNQILTLVTDTTLTFNGPPPSTLMGGFTLVSIQDTTGGRKITWPSSVKWASGLSPTLITSASTVNALTFATYNGGTTWLGFLAGGDLR